MPEDGADPLGTISKVQFNPVRYNLPTLLALTVPRCATNDAFKVRIYLDEVEEVGNNHSMKDGEIIGMALYYADPDHRLLCKVFGDTTGDDWPKFKQEVMRFYPDAFRSEDTGSSSIENSLFPHVLNSRRMGYRTITSIRQYCIQFLHFVNDVQPRLHFSDSKLCYFFAAGLSLDFLGIITQKMHLGWRYSLKSLFEEVLVIWWEDVGWMKESEGFADPFKHLNELATQWEKNLSL